MIFFIINTFLGLDKYCNIEIIFTHYFNSMGNHSSKYFLFILDGQAIVG